MVPLMNKERAVFLVALGIFALGAATLVARTPSSAPVPTVPEEAVADRSVPDPAVRVKIPAPAGLYLRENPFGKTEAWEPPRPGRLPEPPAGAPALALPRPTVAPGVRAGRHPIEMRRPAEAVAPPEENGAAGGSGE